MNEMHKKKIQCRVFMLVPFQDKKKLVQLFLYRFLLENRKLRIKLVYSFKEQ